MKKVWRWLCYPVQIVSGIILVEYGAPIIETTFILIAVSLVNYFDGLTRR